MFVNLCFNSFIFIELTGHTVASLTDEQQAVLNNARSLIGQALEHDEKDDHKKALTLYIQAVEVCRTAVSNTLFDIFLKVYLNSNLISI